MEILSLGLVLFLGVHLIPTLSALKARLVGAFGENFYKAAFSILSAIGLVLIVVGYTRAPSEPRLFSPFHQAIVAAPFVMVVSFVLLAAANMKTYIRAWIKHPMLLGVGLWACVHLLANGHGKATLLFAAFLAYVVIDLISVVQRKSVKSFKPMAKYDVIAIILGTLLALAVMTFHRQLIGVTVVSWGV